ncbi:MAG: TRAP transporter large permease subunit [Deltaproteobacteria bacterium]|nr:TRAP transporter large permease subunit [Deltaproteobacteria bacterium]
MMFLTVGDVLLRYLFDRPIAGAFELTEYLMAVCVSMTLAYCAIHKGHVRVDILLSVFPARAQAVVRSIVTLLGVLFFSTITWQSAIQAEIIRHSGSYSTALRLPVFPFVWVLFAGSALISLVLLRDLRESVSRAVEETRWNWIWLCAGGVIVLAGSAALFWGEEWPWDLSPSTFGIYGICILVLLLFSGFQIGLGIGLTGFLGMAYLSGSDAALTLLATVPYSTIASYGMSIIPLFILMGTFAFYAGLSRDIYWTMYKWLGRLPGGLAMATVGACAGFAAISGSSLATSATMGTVAMHEMKRYKYDARLATGCIAAGGTIGILIPPSVILVIYGIITEQSIGRLFLAGFFPGVLEACFYIVTIYILCKRNPLFGPAGPRTTFSEKVVSLKDSWGLFVLFGLVMGGIYSGICSPTEAAGVGAFGAFLFALGKGKLSWENFTASIMGSGKTTAMIFLIMIGTHFFGYFLAVTRLPFELADMVIALEVNRYIILGIIITVYIFLGAIMDAIAMILITVPIFFPVVTALGFDPIWFGIIIVRVAEIGGITPPVGMNVFIIKGVAQDVPLKEIYKGIFPFLIADICHLGLLIAVPQVALFLPGLMK